MTIVSNKNNASSNESNMNLEVGRAMDTLFVSQKDELQSLCMMAQDVVQY